MANFYEVDMYNLQLGEIELLLVRFLIIIISSSIVLYVVFPRLEELSLQNKKTQELCQHDKSKYREKGFGARPYLRCSICDAIVDDE